MRTLIYFNEFRFSLLAAAKIGLLERDLALLCILLERGTYDRVCYFTFNPADRAFLKECHDEGRLPEGIQILEPPEYADGKLGSIVYSLIGPIIHRKEFRAASALHTHQVSGAWSALVGKLLFRKPLLFRCGYPLSVRFKQEQKSLNYSVARLLEWILMRAADHAGFTSQAMMKYYGAMCPRTPVTWMPNYVDFRAYTPKSNYDNTQPLLYVGRLVDVKNLENIIRACGRLKLALHIFGQGPLEDGLRRLADEYGADVSFKGVVSNLELAKLHHNYSIFLSCSVREGLPKAVVEAMASGLIVVGTKTDGLLELVEDGKTGYLIDGYGADDIADRLDWVIKNFAPEVGRAASRFALDNYSLESAKDVSEQILNKIEGRASAS